VGGEALSRSPWCLMTSKVEITKLVLEGEEPEFRDISGRSGQQGFRKNRIRADFVAIYECFDNLNHVGKRFGRGVS